MNGCFNGINEAEVEEPADKVLGSCWAYITKAPFTRPANVDTRWTVGWGVPGGWANHLNYEGRNCYLADGHARYYQENRLRRAQFAVGPYAKLIVPAGP